MENKQFASDSKTENSLEKMQSYDNTTQFFEDYIESYQVIKFQQKLEKSANLKTDLEQIDQWKNQTLQQIKQNIKQIKKEREIENINKPFKKINTLISFITSDKNKNQQVEDNNLFNQMQNNLQKLKNYQKQNSDKIKLISKIMNQKIENFEDNKYTLRINSFDNRKFMLLEINLKNSEKIQNTKKQLQIVVKDFNFQSQDFVSQKVKRNLL